MELAGAKVLVTGGAVRIGRAIVEALAAAGAEPVIHCNRSWDDAERLADRLRKAGTKAHVVAGDLSDPDACEQVIAEACEAAGGLVALVNNASVFQRHPLAEATRENVLAALQVNTLAPMDLAHAFVRRCGPAGLPGVGSPWLRGKIVNLLDRRIVSTEAGCLPYQLSKKMLADFTRLAALELAPGFTVNGVAPGPILPPPDAPAGENVSERAGPVPLATDCTPAHVAAAVRFLLEQDVVTGQVIFIDGGQHLLGNVL